MIIMQIILKKTVEKIMALKNESEIYKLGENYIGHTIERPEIIFTKGKKTHLIDLSGKKYLDFFNGHGVQPLGYGNKQILKAAKRQMKSLIHTGNHFYNIPQVQLAEKLTEISFGDKIFFANSGAEIVELSIKLARKHGRVHQSTEHAEIITFKNSFHGRTYGALSATNQTKYSNEMNPMLPGFITAEFNNLEDVSTKISAKTCAILIEPILGDGGIVCAEKSFLVSLRQLCTEKNFLLIFDEIQTGLGRTGCAFSYQHYNVIPDLMLLGKCLGGGFPLSALITKNDTAGFLKINDHGSTFGGNPVACASAMILLDYISSKENLHHINSISAELFKNLNYLREKYPSVIMQIRGTGLLIGIQFFPEYNINEIHDLLLRNYFITSVIANNTLRLMPMYICAKKETFKAAEILDSVLSIL